MPRVFALFTLSLASIFSPPPRATSVDIEVKPEVYRTFTFPPGHPPPLGFSALDPREGGLCDTHILPRAAVKLEWNRLGFKSVEATVTLVQFTCSMQIDVWTQEGGGPEIDAHEQTHRAISEHFYAQAESVARRIATSVVGRKVKLPVRGQNEAASTEIDAIDREIVAAFSWQIWSRCRFAQERFDEITNHGQEPITNADAMKQALAEESAHWEKVKDSPPTDDDNR